MIGDVFALDKDDCFKPFTIPFLNFVYNETGVLLKPEDGVPGKYHFDEAHPECGITSDEFTTMIDTFILEHSAEVEPFPDAMNAIQALANITDIHLVTARDPKYKDVTLSSIDRHIGLQYFKDVHVMGSNDSYKKVTKVDTYVAIGASSTADDADHNINAAIDAGLKAFSVQYNGLFHGGHDLDPRAIVVSSLSEILQYADIKQVS